MLKIHCVSCNKSMSVPEKYAGRQGKCPSCGAVNKIPPINNGPLPEPVRLLNVPENNDVANGVYSRQTQPCPMCGENILVSEKQCKHCGEFLNSPGSNVPGVPAAHGKYIGEKKKKSYFNDFFEFRRMLTPRILKTSFVIVLIINAFSALYYIIKGKDPDNMSAGLIPDNMGIRLIIGIGAFFVSVIIARVIFEFCILFFQINETLSDVREELKKTD